MQTEASRDQFERYLADKGLAVERLDAENAFLAMVGFYLDERPEDVTGEYGSDMLLFDYGTYDDAGGRGSKFQYAVTRQFLVEGGCWHLMLTLFFDTDDRTLALGSGESVCASFAELDTFVTDVDSADATVYVRRRAPRAARLDLEPVDVEADADAEEPAEVE